VTHNVEDTLQSCDSDHPKEVQTRHKEEDTTTIHHIDECKSYLLDRTQSSVEHIVLYLEVGQHIMLLCGLKSVEIVQMILLRSRGTCVCVCVCVC
jgi:hypothetical protein